MAAVAQRDQEKRTVEVKRIELVQRLEENLVKHVRDYEEAMAGYKSVLMTKIEESFASARENLELAYHGWKAKVDNMTEAKISAQRDYFTLLDSISVEMKVPRSFAKEYEAAIDMMKWDVRDTLELTHAEFTCFVRDQWDWKSGFDAISTMYKSL